MKKVQSDSVEKVYSRFDSYLHEKSCVSYKGKSDLDQRTPKMNKVFLDKKEFTLNSNNRMKCCWHVYWAEGMIRCKVRFLSKIKGFMEDDRSQVNCST